MTRRSPIRFLYAGIRVRSLERSVRFYRTLGLRIRHRGTMEHGGQWVHMSMPRSSMRLELNYYPPHNRFFTPYRAGTEMDHLGFYVEDVEGWVRRMRRAGGKLPIPPFQETTQRLAYVTDPDGIWIEFFGPARPPRRRRKAPGP